MKKTFALLILTVLFFTSCTPDKLQFATGNFDNALAQAKEQNKHLFVVAMNEGCEACEKYIESLERIPEVKEKLCKDFLVYKCKRSLVGNQYLFQAMYSIASPTVYLFDPQGKLQNIISAKAKPEEIKQNLDIVLLKQPVMGNFGSRLGIDGAPLLELTNSTLNAWNVSQNKNASKTDLQNTVTDLEKSLETRSYFFNNYLLSKLHQQLGNTEKAKTFAKTAMGFNDSFTVYLYQPLRNELRFVVDAQYNKNSEPFIAFEKTNYDYGVVALQSKPKATLPFKNTGKKPLIIEKVFGNCDCMDFDYPKQPIAPGQTGNVTVSYHASYQGGFSKVVYVFSNALNAPAQIALKGVVD